MLTAPNNLHVQQATIAAISVEKDATSLERFAACELQRYIGSLFGMNAPILTRGDPLSETASHLFDLRVSTNDLSEQGIFLGLKTDTLSINGGSPQAVLWGVYVLVERWGVRFLLDRDVLPEDAGEFRFPITETIALEPLLRTRQWRVVNTMALGPESWGIADYRVLLNQLAKLKFNRIVVTTWPHQPFVHLEVNGVVRNSGSLFFGFRYPITDDMPGRWLFGEKETEFWNPDFPLPEAGYGDLAAAGERHLHAIMEHARQRGMESVITVNLLDFPQEFSAVLPNCRPVEQVNSTTIVPGEGVAHDDPGLTALARNVIQTTINTYPEVAAVQIPMPEHRQWTHLYPQAWQALNEKYGLDRICSLEHLLQAARNRPHYFSGERAEHEVCGDLVSLWFVDNLLSDPELLGSTERPDIRVIFSDLAEELFRFLPAMIPADSELLNFIDYTAARVVKRRHALSGLPAGKPDSLLILTLHDDNVGCLPALASRALHELMKELKRHQWAGFSTRYFLSSDHDLVVQYIARAAWHNDVTPADVNREMLTTLCGKACAKQMLLVLEEVEWASTQVAEHDLAFGFPVPGMMTKHFVDAPTPQWLFNCRASYIRALEAAQLSHNLCNDTGKWLVEYWIGRLNFAIGYLDCVDLGHQYAQAKARADQTLAPIQAEASSEVATQKLREAFNCSRAMLEAYAAVARNRSDIGAIAVMSDYIYRPLKALLEDQQQVAAIG